MHGKKERNNTIVHVLQSLYVYLCIYLKQRYAFCNFILSTVTGFTLRIYHQSENSKTCKKENKTPPIVFRVQNILHTLFIYKILDQRKIIKISEKYKMRFRFSRKTKLTLFIIDKY